MDKQNEKNIELVNKIFAEVQEVESKESLEIVNKNAASNFKIVETIKNSLEQNPICSKINLCKGCI